jgi:predicted RNA binding protein YcfA (HicA-like mRNA interferase family)
MAYTANVWNQVKNLSKGTLISALERDGWQLDATRGGIRLYVNTRFNPHRRVEIHYHKSSETFRSPRLLKDVLESIGWSEDDLKRLKLVR